MTATAVIQRLSLAIAFVKAAAHYWLGIYPRTRREANSWHIRAGAIPDQALRDLAFEAHRVKRGNIDGSTAFAILAPRSQRAKVVRAQVAFQSIYDFVDTLSEQANPHPIANSRRLHQALLTALDPDSAQPNYFAQQPGLRDGGYLEEIVDTCRAAVRALPSQLAASDPSRRITKRIVAYQSLNMSESNGGHRYLARWAQKATPPGSGLRWWETAASAGSSLGLFALIAAAARSDLTREEGLAIEAAYWPWIGALHSLLDSLIDAPEDAAAGQRNLLDYYASPEEAAERLTMLARRALAATSSLTGAREHTLILAGMTSFYLTAPEADSPTARLASAGILETLNAAARPSMAVFSLHRRLSRTEERRATG